MHGKFCVLCWGWIALRLKWSLWCLCWFLLICSAPLPFTYTDSIPQEWAAAHQDSPPCHLTWRTKIILENHRAPCDSSCCEHAHCFTSFLIASKSTLAPRGRSPGSSTTVVEVWKHREGGKSVVCRKSLVCSPSIGVQKRQSHRAGTGVLPGWEKHQPLLHSEDFGMCQGCFHGCGFILGLRMSLWAAVGRVDLPLLTGLDLHPALRCDDHVSVWWFKSAHGIHGKLHPAKERK